MMENSSASKSHLPCQSWLGQNGWSTASTPGGPPLNSVASSQHLGLGSSSGQRPSYNHLQTSNQSCLSDLSTLSSTNNLLYKAPHASSHPLPSTMLFPNTAIPSASPLISCAQQSPQTASVLLTANQQKTVPPPSLPQTNQALPLCRPQHLPPPLPHDPYKASFRPPLTSQGLPGGLQDLPMSLPSCGQRASASQPALGGVTVGTAGVAGYAHSYGGATSHEQPQWVPSSHCRGAVKSVPDSAASSNNEPSQENITAQGNNEIWRSVLLHHRAQLVKQLAEMDKLLESIPPDDSTDGSLPTTVQFPPLVGDLSQCEQTKTSNAQVRVEPPSEESKTQQTHCLSDDCASPASFDEHDEACDKPVSARESEKMENTSAESEDDTDPDYLPNTSGDVSDLQSDTDYSSSDESSSSCLSTSADKTSPPPEKKKAKSESCSDEDITKSCASDKKSSHGAVVQTTSNSKEQRIYDKKNYCLFCSKPLCKMSRHLERVHSDEAEVAVAFQYPAHSRERLKIWKKLINQGNFEHNKDVLRMGKGQLAPRKRPNTTAQAKDFLHCLYCQGLYLKKSMFRHMKHCPERAANENGSRIGRKRIASRCALQTLGDLGVTDRFRGVLCDMIYDDITQAVMDDKLILQFGEHMFNLCGSDLKKHEYIRQNLRQLAGLCLKLEKSPL
ncbi:hypothetical protein INR49_000839 [Caranx melampygus]|nr:hypothetical protein INR49_000839 [Caranx melampygus]